MNAIGFSSMFLLVFGLVFVIALILIILSKWYRIVPPSEAHLVVTPRKRMVCASDESLRKNGGKSTYFMIPSWIPFFGRALRIVDITIKELTIIGQETYEKDQARYLVNSSTKYRIVDVEKAAETFTTDDELRAQLEEIVRAAIRAITVKYNVTDVRANKKRMSEEIEEEIRDDLANWGLKLVNFVLVDFQDTGDSSVISNISKRREVQIESETRIDNANRIKDAKVKEAESDQLARDREIERDEAVAKREQGKKIAIAQQEQIVAEEEMKVKRIREIKQEEIDKEQSIIRSMAQKEQRIINAQAEKEQTIISAEAAKEKQMLDAQANKEREIIEADGLKQKNILEAEGIKLRNVLEAEGLKEKLVLEGEGNATKRKLEGEAESSYIEKIGLAEAKVKEELAKSLNAFTADAIRALTAEQTVEKEKAVGLAMAEALKAADLKIISAGKVNNLLELLGSAEGGANLGAMIDSFQKTSGTNISDLVNQFMWKGSQESPVEKE